MSSEFEFDEVKEAADEVRFKKKEKKDEFRKEMEKLETAIGNNKKFEYNKALKNIRELIKNKNDGSRFKELEEKLKQLESKVRNRGAIFSCIILGSRIDESGAVGGCKQSSETDSIEITTDKKRKTGGRIQSSASSTSSSGSRVKQENQTKEEKQFETSSGQGESCNDEYRIEIENLFEKLQSTCKKCSIQDNTDKKSSNVGTKDKKSPIKQQFDRVNEQVDRIIVHLEMTRGMSNVKCKAQDKIVKNATEKVESEAKARMGKVITCLKKLKEQIDANKVDVKEFQKLEGSQEEKQIKACLEDICVKVNNIRDTGKGLTDMQKILESEITSLKNEITHFYNTDEPAIQKVTQNQPKLVKDIQDARNQLSKIKKEVAKETVERGAKLQRKVDELWELTFDSKNNTKDNKGDEDNLLGMLEKIAPEIKKLADIQKILESEITSLKNDLTHFDDTNEPSISKFTQNQPKLVKDILDARNQLSKIKKEVAKETVKRKSTDREAKLQQQVDELWNLTFDPENNTKVNKGDENNLQKMLGKITPEIKKLKDLQTRLETEIKAINDDVAKFDDPIESSVAKVDSKQPGILNDILKARKQLSIKKKDVAKQMKDSKEDENKGISTLKQHVINLWQLTTGTKDFPEIDDHDSLLSSEKLLKDIKLHIKEIEDHAFKVEKQAHTIYVELTCSKDVNTDDPKTAVDILKSSFAILQSCLLETKASVTEINTLEDVLSVRSNSTSSISKRCDLVKQKLKGWIEIHEQTKSLLDQSVETLTESYTQLLGKPYHFDEPERIKKSVTGNLPDWLQNIQDVANVLQACIENNQISFQERFVSRERLNEEKGKLQGQIKQLEAEKDSAYNRLSKVAGARLTDNNPNIADLSDPNRPTKIAEQYSELYDSPWTDAFESLKKGEQENTEFLLEIIVDCYEICGQISKNHQQKLQRAVCFPAGDRESPQPSKTKKFKKENSISFSAVQSKALSELRKQTADISVDDVKSHIKSEQTKWFVTKDLEKYTTICIELCWLMHVQTPPVVIDRSAKHGTKFDTNRYKQYTKAGEKVDFVVWPVLLLEEGGAILCKGVAQGK